MAHLGILWRKTVCYRLLVFSSRANSTSAAYCLGSRLLKAKYPCSRWDRRSSSPCNQNKPIFYTSQMRPRLVKHRWCLSHQLTIFLSENWIVCAYFVQWKSTTLNCNIAANETCFLMGHTEVLLAESHEYSVATSQKNNLSTKWSNVSMLIISGNNQSFIGNTSRATLCKTSGAPYKCVRAWLHELHKLVRFKDERLRHKKAASFPEFIKVNNSWRSVQSVAITRQVATTGRIHVKGVSCSSSEASKNACITLAESLVAAQWISASEIAVSIAEWRNVWRLEWKEKVRSFWRGT